MVEIIDMILMRNMNDIFKELNCVLLLCITCDETV